MRIRYQHILAIALWFIGIEVAAQDQVQMLGLRPPPPADINANATNLLDNAKLHYTRGELESVPELLEQFISDPGVRRGLRLEGFRLLTNSHLAMDRIRDAEQSYLQLLRLRPTFRPNQRAGDQPQMAWLAMQFKSTAAWHLAATVNLYSTSAGLNTHRQDGVSIFKDFDTDVYEKIKSLAVGAGLSAIIPVTQFIEFTAGFEYQELEFRHRYEFETNGPVDLGSYADRSCNGRGTLTMAEAQRYVAMPVAIRYYPLRNDHYPGRRRRDFMPYFQAGISVQLRTGGEIWQYNSRIFAEPRDSCIDARRSYPITDFTDRVAQWNVVLSGGGGVKYKVGAHHVFVEANYSWQLANTRSGESPGDPLERVYFVDNDYKLQFLTIRAGAAYSFYRPKLLNGS